MTAFPSLPVLMYHHISPHAGDTVTITPAAFAAQMAWLAREGYGTLSLADLEQYLRTGRKPEGRRVVLTFDDGWLDNYLHAFPVLQRHGFHAVFFLVTDRVDAASRGGGALQAALPDHAGSKELLATGEAGQVVLTWDLVRQMAATGLAEFHSHTAAHRPCDELTDEELAGSLERARSALQMELGCASDWLCWPYGRYSTAAVRRAVASGYRYLVTTEPGMVTVATSPLAIPRLAVTEESIADFVSGCRLSAAAMQEGASP